VLAICLIVAAAGAAEAQRAIFLVRHAEKVDDSPDAALSEAGRARAALLARNLRDAGITAIFSSDFQRTRNTAQPLADALNLRVTVIGRDAPTVVARVRALSNGQSALVVAHSDTLPGILRALGHRQSITIPDTEYDNVFLVVPRAAAPPTVIRLRY
jgi:broad specificity phosphatase PhoE